MSDSSRPSSARPKTSGGRAPSARRPPRPDAPMGNGAVMIGSGSTPLPARPPSRAVVSRMGTPISNSTSMASLGLSSAPPPPPPRSVIGSRAGSSHRISTSMGDRPITGLARPPSSALSTSVRPVTQQGLSGGRAVSRLGTGSTRQVFDKSYYMGQLRAKLNQLTAEINKLDEIHQKGEKDRIEMVAYEKRATESALEISTLQGQLVDYNVIIDRMNTNRDMMEIEIEARSVRTKADEVYNSVQELFNDRKEKEQECENTAAETEEQRRLNQAIIAGMEPGLRDRYEEAKTESETLQEEVADMERELNDLEEKKLNLEVELQNSPLKKKAIQLHESVAALDAKESTLRAEKDAQETPEQKKEKLLEQLRKNNEDIATIEKQIEQTREHVELTSEELRDFENDAEQKHLKNNEKYRELQQKEQEYEEFLSQYDEAKSLLTMEIEEYADGAHKLLQKMSHNLGKVSLEANVTGMDPDGLTGQLHEKATPKELQDLHVRLQEELISMEDMETRLRSETETLNRRISEMHEQMEQFGDIDKLSIDAENDIKELENRRRELENLVPDSEAKSEDLREKEQAMSNKLQNDPNYSAQQSLIKKLDILRAKNEGLKEQVEKQESETNYEQLKKEVLRLRTEYNAYLVKTAGKK